MALMKAAATAALMVPWALVSSLVSLAPGAA